VIKSLGNACARLLSKSAKNRARKKGDKNIVFFKEQDIKQCKMQEPEVSSTTIPLQ